MKIHHIGYLVDNIKKAAHEFEMIGYTQKGEVSEDESRQVYIQFLENGGYLVELIQPIDESSPVYGLRKRFRNAPYHICYETDDLQQQIDTCCSGGGYIMLQPPKPAPAITGCPNVAFLTSTNIGMIELVERVAQNEA